MMILFVYVTVLSVLITDHKLQFSQMGWPPTCVRAYVCVCVLRHWARQAQLVETETKNVPPRHGRVSFSARFFGSDTVAEICGDKTKADWLLRPTQLLTCRLLLLREDVAPHQHMTTCARLADQCRLNHATRLQNGYTKICQKRDVTKTSGLPHFRLLSGLLQL